MRQLKIIKIILTGLFLFFAFIGNIAASIVADFTINGVNVNNAVDQNNTLTIKVGDILELRYTGGHSECTDVEWYITYQGKARENFSHYENTDIKIMTAGTHKLKMTADGFTNYLNCWRGNEYAEKEITLVVQGNNYPIVLIGGLLCYGRDERDFSQHTDIHGKYAKYWGRRSGDLEEIMNNRGFDVFTASVSPLGSAWDRACELYAQLKGGTPVKNIYPKGDVNWVEKSDTYVDYGAAHAKKVTDRAAAYEFLNVYDPAVGKNVTRGTHKRFGNLHLAKVMKNSKDILFTQKYNFPATPIHLVIHSYGGQTARIFMELMKNGSPNGNEGNSIPASPLFNNGGTPRKNFVRSLTTIASPHNGTDLTYVINDAFSLIKRRTGLDVVTVLSCQAFEEWAASPMWLGYRLDLRQWPYTLPYEAVEIQPAGGQYLYLDGNGKLINDLRPIIEDISVWDLSPAGSKEINMKCPASHFANETYYFTYNGEQSFESSGGLIGKQGWWYFEDQYLRTYTWNIVPGTDNGGTMAPFCMLWSDGMGSGTYTTSLSITKKSLNKIPSNPQEEGYVPDDLVQIVRDELGDNICESIEDIIIDMNNGDYSSAVELFQDYMEIAQDYLGNSQDLSEGWKFSDDPHTGRSREENCIIKLSGTFDQAGVSPFYYYPYLDALLHYGTLELDLSEIWRQNDGVVNTIASIAPWTDSFVTGTQFVGGDPKKPIANSNLAPQTGKWLYLGTFNEDHFDVVGGFDWRSSEAVLHKPNTAPVNVFDFYEQHFLRLRRLPAFN